MNHPRLYQQANQVQRRDAEEIIKEYFHRLQWRSEGCDALLDIGSGSGDVLMDFIYTNMPKNFERIVASDISPQMLNYAKKMYSSYEKFEFRELDISTEKALPNDLKEKFDHVTSFYCLHWIDDKRQALRNIYSLLRAEGGDCLLVFLAGHPINEVYKILSKSNKWSGYMKDVDQYIKPFQYATDPKLEFSAALKETGFTDIEVEVQHRVVTYYGLKTFKENFKAINPFVDRMPISLHDSFFDDMIDITTRFDSKHKHPSKEGDFIFRFPYKLMVAYAKKCPTNARG